MKRGTLTTTRPIERGQFIAIDDGPVGERVKVLHCTGAGPYTVTMRHETWLDRAWRRALAPFRRVRRAARSWRLSRCDVWWCWRREAIVDEDWCGWCRVHARER